MIGRLVPLFNGLVPIYVTELQVHLMIEINSHSIRSRFITCIKEIPFYLYEFGGNGASTARLYIYLLMCLVSPVVISTK